MVYQRFIVVIALVFASLAQVTRAATLTLDTGKAVSFNQGTSGSFTFSFLNTGAVSEDDGFLAWTLGIQLLPAGGNTGSLTLGSLTQPVVDPRPEGAVDILDPTAATLVGGASINGTTSYFTMGIQATEIAGSLDNVTHYNMGNLTLTASGDAVGVWNMYAVQQASGERSYWLDVKDQFTTIDFSNLPRSAGNSSLLLGTVTINAVPEPGTLALSAVGAGLAAAWRWRRRVGRPTAG